MQVQAAVLRTADGPFVVDDVVLDQPGPGEIAVRVVGVCRTDVVPRVVPIAKLPLVAGHEGAGIVESLGPNVTGIEDGEHVVLSFDSCGACESCLAAHPAYCDAFGPRNVTGRRLDGSTNIGDAQGDPLGGRWFGQSSFAGVAVVDARNVVVVDRNLPIELLGPLGRGVLTGAGAVGLFAVMAAGVAGASTIVTIDLAAITASVNFLNANPSVGVVSRDADSANETAPIQIYQAL